jgi:hypothetical protein
MTSRFVLILYPGMGHPRRASSFGSTCQRCCARNEMKAQHGFINDRLIAWLLDGDVALQYQESRN